MPKRERSTENRIVIEALRILQAEHRMNRRELAEALGLSTSSLSRSMNEHREWEWADMCRAVDYFDIPFELLRAPTAEVHRYLAGRPQRGSSAGRRARA